MRSHRPSLSVPVLAAPLLVFLLAFHFAPADARAQMAAMTLEDLSRTSTEIVVGETLQKRSFWNESRSQILTEITVRVDDSVKGNAVSEVVITVPGGRVGNTLYEVSDMPVFGDGEDVLVFVWEHPSGKALVNGGSQGKLDVVEDPVTGKRMLRGAPLAGPELRKAGAALGPGDPADQAPLEDVLNEIRTYVGSE